MSIKNSKNLSSVIDHVKVPNPLQHKVTGLILVRDVTQSNGLVGSVLPAEREEFLSKWDICRELWGRNILTMDMKEDVETETLDLI